MGLDSPGNYRLVSLCVTQRSVIGHLLFVSLSSSSLLKNKQWRVSASWQNLYGAWFLCLLSWRQ